MTARWSRPTSRLVFWTTARGGWRVCDDDESSRRARAPGGSRIHDDTTARLVPSGAGRADQGGDARWAQAPHDGGAPPGPVRSASGAAGGVLRRDAEEQRDRDV